MNPLYLFLFSVFILFFWNWINLLPKDHQPTFCPSRYKVCSRLFNHLLPSDSDLLSQYPYNSSQRITPRPAILCHRGGRGMAPENTMASMDYGVSTYCDALEFDFHLSKDGYLIMSHDPFLSRVTNLNLSSLPDIFPHLPQKPENLLISSLTYAQIMQLDFGYHFTPDQGKTYPFRGKGVKATTVDQVFQKYGGRFMMVEAKDPQGHAAHILYHKIKQYQLEDYVMVGTKWTDTWFTFKNILQDTPVAGNKIQTLGFYFHNKFFGGNNFYDKETDAPLFEFLVAPWTHPIGNFNQKRFVDDAHHNGILMFHWTLNTKEDVYKAVEIGTDAIITDFPEIVGETLIELGFQLV